MSKAVGSFIPARVAILTVSDTRTLETDTSGALVQSSLEEKNHHIVSRVLLKDNQHEIREHAAQMVANPEVDVLIITGGTGISDRDITPEAVQPLFDKEIPGFGELFRYLSFKDIGTSTIQSRALAGLAQKTLIFCLPGSTGACRLAMEQIILEQIDSTHRPCNFMTLLRSP